VRVLKHVLIVSLSLFLILGLPFLCSDYFKNLISGTDAVTSATVILDSPTGEFVVLINKDMREDDETLQTWKTFFSGGEIDFLFEDISCFVGQGDASGKEMAESFMSRLPENQMTTTVIDPTLMLSKAGYGKFDIIIMSAEYAAAYSADTLYGKDFIEVVTTDGGEA